MICKNNYNLKTVKITAATKRVLDKASMFTSTCNQQGLVVTQSRSAESFTILHSTTLSFQVKIKEALYLSGKFQQSRHLDWSLSC